MAAPYGGLLVELAVGDGDEVLFHVADLEPRVGVERRPPTLAGVVAAEGGRMVRRMDARVGIQGVDDVRIHIGRQDPLVLGDGIVGPLVGGRDVRIDPAAHHARPGLAPIGRLEHSPGKLALLNPAGNDAVEDRQLIAARSRRRRSGCLSRAGRSFFGPRGSPSSDRQMPSLVAAKQTRRRAGLVWSKWNATVRPCGPWQVRQVLPPSTEMTTARSSPAIIRSGSPGSMAISPQRSCGVPGSGSQCSPPSRLTFIPRHALGGKDDAGVRGVKRGPAAGAGAKLALVDHLPVLAAVPGDIGPAHVAVEHQQVRIDRTDGRCKHTAVAGKPQRLPGDVRGNPRDGTGQSHCQRRSLT